LAGIFVGDLLNTWESAADLSSQQHNKWVERPYHRVLSCAPPMYDELWTGGKAMHKLEPVVTVGRELIIYAPHLKVVSHVHGKYLFEPDDDNRVTCPLAFTRYSRRCAKIRSHF